MVFIFPKNYNFKNRFLGIIDYYSLVFVIIWCLFIFSFINVFPFSFYFKTLLFIILCFPVLIFGIIGFNNENICYVLLYLFKFLTSQKIYLFSKRQ